MPHDMNAVTTDLFDTVQVGALALRNRIVMAPLTRSRAGAGDVPGAMNAEYYAQRATAGLIVSEATQITQQGKGYAWTPGIHSPEQVAGWHGVTDAVHAKGGLIVLQLWHVGRISHPDLQPGHGLPVAPSAIAPGEMKAFTEDGFKPIPVPRALELRELPGIVATMRAQPSMRAPPGSTAWRSTQRTATCWTSSCATARTNAPTRMAAASPTACA